ncbi:hypothetical protein [Pseudoalteromonas lipolytica]|uniref:Uncharacterized protein n=1 Tax=Pseudoalteromonas lipolytica TaxID=570156 RepID=A0A0P7EC22_9GAMM|nr:hypothetical protein [Pseudoalteromonas lipolytica]KPM85514.1 hypothetical protein AOG27_01650 [Pseudoalteromonas lipolytica]
MKYTIAVLAVLSFILVYFFSANLVSTEIKDILSGLLSISAAVLTISGLWLAILYPEAVRDLAKEKIASSEETYNVKVVEKLVICIVSSAFIMAFVVLRGLIYSFYSPGYNLSIDQYLNFFGLWVLVFAIFMQLLTFFVVITLCLDFASKLHDLLEDKKGKDDLL